MPEYAAKESKEHKIIIAVAVVIFLVVVWVGISAAFPEKPPHPVTILYEGEQVFPWH
jgi:hypothetical protein